MRRYYLLVMLASVIVFSGCTTLHKPARPPLPDGNTSQEEVLIEQLGAAEIDLVLRDVKRTFRRDTSGRVNVGLTFTAGPDANDRTLRQYVFRVVNPDGSETQTTEAKHSSICSRTEATGAQHERGPACVVALVTVDSRERAKELVIEAGFMSRVAVQFIKNAGTVQGGIACESELIKDCKCHPCSVGEVFAEFPIALSTNALRTLQLMAILHLHQGWIMRVP